MKISEFYNKRYEGSTFKNNLDVKFTSNWVFECYKELSKMNLNNKKVLDIGAGDGFLLRKLRKEKNIIPYAADLSKDTIKFLIKQNINVVEKDVSTEKLPFKNNFFDVIILTEVIEHLFDCEHALKEINRVLKKDGIFLISTHNSFNFAMRIKYLLGIIPTPSLDVSSPSMGEHIRLFNKKLLLKLLKRNNFIIIENLSWFKLGILKFKTKFLTSILSRHLFFSCTKK